MRQRASASLVASPVLIGAVTVLISVIAVFIAYNANQGLPFVPTYEVRAQVPSGAKLVKGNEVRVGGFRVGVVDDIRPDVLVKDGRRRAIAILYMKLDKTVEPLAVDTKIRVRPRSALGLKYVEITPGREKATYKAGDAIPIKNASEPLELEDVLSTFDDDTRINVRNATSGFGDAFTGRGFALNETIRALNPLFRHLTPVMRNLADPATGLDQFFRQLGRTTAQVAPVARTQAVLFTNMADTFAAISSVPESLQATIEKSPGTLDAAITSFPVMRPFLGDFADLSRRLRPAAQELPRSLPAINRAVAVGTPVLPRTVRLNNRLEGAMRQLDNLFENPNTLLTLKDLRTAVTVTRPAIQFIAPYQTVCNHLVYFLHPLGEAQSATIPGILGGGTALNQNVKLVNLGQPNNLGTVESQRPHDIFPGQKPQGAVDSGGGPLSRLYSPPYSPAVDAQGNADCEVGQKGYPNGKLSTGAPYGPGLAPNGDPSGGNAPISDNNLPMLVGGTYKSRELGIDNVRDVP